MTNNICCYQILFFVHYFLADDTEVWFDMLSISRLTTFFFLFYVSKAVVDLFINASEYNRLTGELYTFTTEF